MLASTTPPNELPRAIREPLLGTKLRFLQRAVRNNGGFDGAGRAASPQSFAQTRFPPHFSPFPLIFTEPFFTGRS
ncbi:hypothetical protein NDU88_000382 [Pleurodeles waltl]|uniref:Uncharacterized protein n=1 Tax=Pleurodeles waltl TaxID=8319 RepID=A0AAV7TG49_PLEWA|nr:hypothetical protein NDU88_000382 [Pleurodeles waltl]